MDQLLEVQAKDDDGPDLYNGLEIRPFKLPRIYRRRVHSTDVPYKVLVGERVVGLFPSLEEAKEEAQLHPKCRIRVAYVRAYKSSHHDLTMPDVFVYKRIWTREVTHEDLYYAKIRWAVMDHLGRWHWCFVTVKLPRWRSTEWKIKLPGSGDEEVEIPAWRFVSAYAKLNARHKKLHWGKKRKSSYCEECYFSPCRCCEPG